MVNLPWTEKYRPRSLHEIILDKRIKDQLISMSITNEIPNVIFEGPPGVGKTSTVRCLARAVYGNYYGIKVLELNASDERGVKIQQIIENFRRSHIHVKRGDTVAPYKLVILDEADNITEKAMHILNTFIEKNKNELRFIFTCNTKIGILPSIQSACTIIRYPPLSDEILYDRLKGICESEIVHLDIEEKKGLLTICKICSGDMRKAINMLQMVCVRFDEEITEENVYKLYDKPHPEISRKIIMDCQKKDLKSALERIKKLKKSGYSGTDITIGLFFVLKLNICDIPEESKVKFGENISYTMYNLSKGLDSSLLQISACLADMCK